MTREALGALDVAPDGSAVTLKVPHAAEPFLLLPLLTRGVGSSSFWMDRGEPSGARHVRWVRAGAELALVELNTHFLDTAAAGSSRAAADSFARSALFRAPVLSEDAQGAVVDVTALALSDVFDIAARSTSPDWADVAVDGTRSWLLASETRQHDAGIELAAELTLTGIKGTAVEPVTPDRRAVTVTQRITFLPLPERPMPARRYRPASGGYRKRFTDFALPQDGSQESGWQPRFRLERTDPGSGPSAVVAPIVFTLDPEVPEPWATAFIEGGNWWREGFERAGFLDAYRVERGTPGQDLAAAGTNPLWWVHRDDRGWSVGAGLTDPRTGEILKGNVRFGSQRVQQLTSMGEALLSPYGRSDEAERVEAIRNMTLARIRQLSAHEIGHALGFMHNYASHLDGKLSVMDYPHPALALDDAGEITLAGAYGAGLSEWDVFTVRTSYEQFPDGQEAAGLDALREEATAGGHRFITDHDAQAPSASSTHGVPWIFGADPIDALRTVMAVRAKALADFSRGAAPRGSQTGELERRYVIVHLLHRNHIVAVARLLGGVDYAYGDVSDPATAPVVVPAADQHRALGELAALLGPAVVAVPGHVTAIIAPPSIGFSRGSGDVTGRLGPVFDPLAAAAVSAAIVCDLLFEPARLGRASFAHAADPASPGIAEILGAALAGARTAGGGTAADAQVAETARAEIVRAVVAALRSGALHASARGELEDAAREAAAGLPEREGRQLLALLDDPDRKVPWPAPVIPLGAPI